MSTLDPSRPLLVFDVLGTLVDQAGSLRREIISATGRNEIEAGSLVSRWLEHVAAREREIITGDAPFVPSHVLDAEAVALLVADGELPPVVAARLSTASGRLDPWPDSVDGLARLAGDATVAGLSNASHEVLSRLIETSGMRWQLALSAEDAGTYKPAPSIYQLAMAAAPQGAPPPVMVAAHAWDLRAAAEAGMRTAYVPRPGGDPPSADDAFDLHADDLAHLQALLRA